MYIRCKRLILVVALMGLSGFLCGIDSTHTYLGQIVGVEAPQLLATRYYARNRTSNFFQRSANNSPRKNSSTHQR